VDFLDTVSERDRHQIGTTDDFQELEEDKTLDFIGATRRIRTDDLLITNKPQSRTTTANPDLPVYLQRQRHRFDRSSRVVAHSVLNGLHHEYSLSAWAAWVSSNFCGEQAGAAELDAAGLQVAARRMDEVTAIQRVQWISGLAFGER
jgi:hypothetical protein